MATVATGTKEGPEREKGGERRPAGGGREGARVRTDTRRTGRPAQTLRQTGHWSPSLPSRHRSTHGHTASLLTRRLTEQTAQTNARTCCSRTSGPEAEMQGRRPRAACRWLAGAVTALGAPPHACTAVTRARGKAAATRVTAAHSGRTQEPPHGDRSVVAAQVWRGTEGSFCSNLPVASDHSGDCYLVIILPCKHFH